MIRSFRDEPGLQAPPVISRLISAAEKKRTNCMRTHAAHLAPQKSTPSRSPSIMMRRHLKPHIMQQDPVIVYPPMTHRQRFPGKYPIGCCLFGVVCSMMGPLTPSSGPTGTLLWKDRERYCLFSLCPWTIWNLVLPCKNTMETYTYLIDNIMGYFCVSMK